MKELILAQQSTPKRGASGKASTAKSSAKTSSKQTKGSRTSSQTKRQQADTRLVNDAMRHDILGIALIVLGIIILVGALVPTSGVVTTFVHQALHLALGVGSYILPVALVIIGIVFLIRFSEYRIPTRVVIGISLIFLAILVITSLCTPVDLVDRPKQFFAEAELTKRGGYLGSGIAWVLLKLLGQPVSIVIMAGIIVVGLIIIGFSVSSVVEKIRAARTRLAENRIRNATVTDTRAQYRDARVQRGTNRAMEGYPTSDYALPEGRGEYAPTYADTETLSTRLLNRLKGPRDEEVDPTAETAAFAEPSRRLANKTYGAPAASGAAAPTASLNRYAASPSGSALPPAAPLPTRGYDRVDASTADTAPVTGPTQPMTRKLSHKTSAKTAVAATKSAAPAQDPSMTGKLAAAASADMGGYQLPSMSLLQSSTGGSNKTELNNQAAQTAQVLQNTLADFNVFINVVGWVPGPTVTLYKLELPPGLKVQTINNLSADVSRALMVDGIRIYSPVKGTPYVGIEVPNKKRETVCLADVLKDAPAGPLQVAIGKNVDGKSIVEDLSKMPHLLIGGTTGSGKSIAMHGMIVSILMRATPAEVRFIMIDPKRVEFNHYEDIPHLYVPPVTDPKEASSALSWAVAEMELRLKKFQKARARDIKSYNAMIDAGQLDVENAQKLPYIVIVIDELADLMMNVGKEVEFSISRIAQLARAAGIHLIIATQRPDANIVTGLIKANITNRIALKVSSGTNSRVIIDQTGAENLIGKGDMLFQTTDSPKPTRIQGCYVSDKEIDAVVEAWKVQGTPEYNDAILTTNKVTVGDQKTSGLGGDDTDPLLWEAADLVVSNNFASTSTIQRKLSVGYARAGRIMDQLEEKGIVGPSNGSKPREVLVGVEELEAIKAFDTPDD